MALAQLVHQQGSHEISVAHLITKCDLFKNNPVRVSSPYPVQSRVSFDDFRDFVTALEDKPIDINDSNFSGLSQLSHELGFQDLLIKLSTYRRSPRLVDWQTAECRSRISSLEERAGQHEHQLAALQPILFAALQRFETDLMRLASAVKVVCNAKNSDSPLPAASAMPPSRPTEFPPAAVPPSAPTKLAPVMKLSIPAQPGLLESLIVSEFPPLFDEFRMKRWPLLWRGNRDGFTAEEFHRRCDGQANTLTLILDTDGNVFGGFTPVAWENSGGGKTDHSMHSFLFTLKNPHGVPSRKFALKKENKVVAIYCYSKWCAGFGNGDICVQDNCNTNRNSWTHIGSRWRTTMYVNKTKVEDFFTGAEKFTVKEIEVFEMIH
jgi:hypothetical protein